MASAFLIAACNPADRDHSLPAALDAPTFVSLNPCLDAILVETAAPEQILALSHYSRDPASSSVAPEVAARHDFTGGTAEEVLALQPDIVLASIFIAPATRAAFQRLGVRVETFGSPTTVEESLAQVRRVADLTGNGDAGERLVTRVEDSAPGPTVQPVSTLLWQPGQIVPGEATLIGALMRESGLASHSAARGLEQGDYVALEALVADPPELLLVAGSAAGQRHPMLDELQATHVELLEPQLLYCGGPTIVKVRERLRGIRERIEHRNAIPLEAPLQAAAGQIQR